MFTSKSNVLFNNKAFRFGKIVDVPDKQIHPSMHRLYHAAHSLRDVSGQSAVGRLLNASPQKINNWERRGISQAGAIRAQEVIGCSASWLVGESGEMVHKDFVPAAKPQEDFDLLARGPDRAVIVPALANGASMGGGEELMDEDVVTGHLALSPTWIGMHIKPSRAGALRFIHGYGDSMSPTFQSGDILLVDTGVIDHKVDGIYVLKAHDRLFIKRVRQRMDGSFEVSSDNPTHKTVDVLSGNAQVAVLGRVVWAWNGQKL